MTGEEKLPVTASESLPHSQISFTLAYLLKIRRIEQFDLKHAPTSGSEESLSGESGQSGAFEVVGFQSVTSTNTKSERGALR